MSLLTEVQSGWAQGAAPPSSASRNYLAQPAGIELAGADYAIVGVVMVIALAALAFGYVLIREVLSAGQGTSRMKDIAKAVQEGASAYLNRQFRTLAVFAAAVVVLLLALPAETTAERIGRSIFFLFGAAFSAVIGYLGMWLATRANLRVAAAARESVQAREKAMRIAFRTGGVVGMTTVGLGLFGATLVVLVYAGAAPRVLEGFGFGAALLAMFMRVGGGIFTKAADVGADLVGKVEQNIPEDDPRNAATIADNVGDNVGDCAGMAADLFESYAVTLVASLILGTAAFGVHGLLFPLIVPAIGVLTAVLGVYITKARAGENALKAINRSFYISAVISAVLCAAAALVYLPDTFAGLRGVSAEISGLDGNPALIALAAVVIGILLAAVILKLTGYFTGTEHGPVKDVGKSSLTGAATVILSGISVGFESAVYTALVIGAAVFAAFLLSGSIPVALFAVALAGCGLLTTVGVIVAMDTFGPVSDNAQGIAEMSGDVEGEGAQVLTELDAVGNTTKAITKGIAIATAVLAATALFGSYTDAITKAVADVAGSIGAGQYLVYAPNVLFGVIIGAAVVLLFAGLAINAVSRAAGAVVYEVRRQFKDKPGIMDGSQRPEYGRVVDICTKDSLRELATPGLLAVLAPIAVGFGLGVGPLAGYLAGAIATGSLMAIFLANSGGAWDNSKKLVEDGHHGGKGSEAHAATVIGDTVGDPFKDTAGPAINPLLKVMNLVSVLIAPAVVTFSTGEAASVPVRAGIAVLAVAVIVAAVVVSKRRGTAIAESSASEGNRVANGAV
ncbi:sodium-translocating pyrophosphatase [Saccharopolyspora rectivirgula]|jgi:K(+)-stimulated pyrophosphate-energized sodium pump|uniref:K(+)-insensitive pyrophosphate-energized proton pump n=1 Tax=Saccharopolyspora rectivirgula TaxID=28042 RepID=A0A073AWK9_9PSEU|nr:sodium-translocating pyrophosphatase [Saccharopolyspora rectivirgula]KEI43706.1 potassium transporter [Saccharopolyspora rectivirgula]